MKCRSKAPKEHPINEARHGNSRRRDEGEQCLGLVTTVGVVTMAIAFLVVVRLVVEVVAGL